MPSLIYLAALALAHAFDYVSFLVMFGRHGIAAEANPVVIGLVDELGLPGLTLAKVAAVLLAAAVTVILYRRRPAMALTVVIFGIAAGLIGGISNVAAL